MVEEYKFGQMELGTWDSGAKTEWMGKESKLSQMVKNIKENSEILGNGKHLLDKLKGALRAYKNNQGGGFSFLWCNTW